MDYDDIANMSFDEIPPEKNLPNGTWVLVAKRGAFIPPKDNLNARVLIFYNVDEPVDVDEEALAELGADYDYTQNQITKTFWLERNRDWDQVKAHLAMLGADNKGNILDVLKNGVGGRKIVAELKIESFQDRAGETKEQNTPVSFAAVE